MTTSADDQVDLGDDFLELSSPDPVVCQNSAERLRGPLVVVVQHPAEPFATLDASCHVDSASLIVDQRSTTSMSGAIEHRERIGGVLNYYRRAA